MTYNRAYIGFISCIDVALDRLRMQVSVNNMSKEASMPNRNFFENLKKIRCRMKDSCEEKWTIDSMCSELNVSRSYLQRMYKEYFGKTIFEELNDFRLKKARKLIEETSGSISEIAENCGFSTYSFFLKKFKEAYGASPSELRNSTSQKYRT